MRLSQVTLAWLISFIVTIYLTQGTAFQTFAILIFLSPTAGIALHLAGIKGVYGLSISCALLTYILGVTYYLGYRHSAIDPVYLPVTISLLSIYAYSWWRIRKHRETLKH